MLQCSDRARGQQLLHLGPDRRIGDHEGLRDDNAVAVARGDEGVDLLCLQCNRLFAQNVFAGIGGLDGPLHMLRCRKRNVNRVDDIGSQHFLIGTEGVGHGKTIRHRARPGEIPAGYGADHAVLCILYRRNDVILSDFRR
ncbi:hypothetical protein D3C72_1384660 [compost metagenome]